VRANFPHLSLNSNLSFFDIAGEYRFRIVISSICAAILAAVASKFAVRFYASG
jgi:hypothetical protein